MGFKDHYFGKETVNEDVVDDVRRVAKQFSDTLMNGVPGMKKETADKLQNILVDFAKTVKRL